MTYQIIKNENGFILNGDNGKRLVNIVQTENGFISLVVEAGRSEKPHAIPTNTVEQTLAKLSVDTSTKVDAFVCKAVYAFLNPQTNKDGTGYEPVSDVQLRTWFEGRVKPLISLEREKLRERKRSKLMYEKDITTNAKGDIKTTYVYKSAAELAEMVEVEKRKTVRLEAKLAKLENK